MTDLSISPILGIVDVEGQGAGDVEKQVGDDGHRSTQGGQEKIYKGSPPEGIVEAGSSILLY